MIIFTTDSWITEITQLVLNPPHAPTCDEPNEEEQEDPTPAESNAGIEPEVLVSEVPNVTTSSTSYKKAGFRLHL